MKASWMTTWRRMRQIVAGAVTALVLAGCGGGGGGSTPPPVTPPIVDPNLADGNSTNLRLVINAVPPPPTASAPGGATTTLRVHYKRTDGNYADWQMYTWGSASSPTWPDGWDPDGTDAFGVYFDAKLTASTNAVTALAMIWRIPRHVVIQLDFMVSPLCCQSLVPQAPLRYWLIVMKSNYINQ